MQVHLLTQSKALATKAMPSCDHCDQPAVYHDVRIINGVHNTTHLCADHAFESGMMDGGPVHFSSDFVFEESSTTQGSMKACTDCGMTIAQYKQTSFLGCPACYTTFKTELLTIIAQVQDKHTQHIGRAPSQSNVDLDRHLQIRRLLRKLQSAVNQEQYEDAAELRDQLRELHDSGEQHEN